jgi:hypothetical protein
VPTSTSERTGFMHPIVALAGRHAIGRSGGPDR